MPAITLFGANGSPFVRKVLFALAEKQIDFEHVHTVPVADPPPGMSGITADLKPGTSLGKVPFLRVDGRWLSDSSVIVAYLDRLHPTPPLYPTDPWEYARALWFEEYIDGGAVPKLFNTIFFERVLAPMLFGRPTDQNVVRKAITEDLPKIYGYLNEEIGSRNFLVGESYSVADVTAASFFRSMQQADVVPDPGQWPNLARYIRQQHSRPAAMRVFDQESTGGR